MMANWALLIDYEICFNCQACVVACMQENDLAVFSWINVITVGPRIVENKLLVDYIPVTCTHCAKPACADACPTEAITKRQDGIVLLDEGLCNGCMACISACPFAVIRFNAEKGVVQKCNLCLHRIESGLKPACVQHCQAGAILFGDINEIAELMQKQRIRRSIMNNSLSHHIQL
jgi:Fe-S-cluster-containing dehydrogenase component